MAAFPVRAARAALPFLALVTLVAPARGEAVPAPAKASAPPITRIECPGFDKLAASYQARYFEPMRTWSSQHFARLNARRVLYPFSGADIVTPVALFGDATHLVLVADQRPEWNDAAAAPGQVAQECQTQAFFSRLGYFRTNDLEGKDAVRPRFTKLLAYSVAMAGGRIDSMVPLRIDADGAASPVERGDGVAPDGLRFAVTSREGRALTVDYLRIDLANGGLKATNRFHRFLSAQAGDTVFLKSASHLLQKPYFSALAELITARAQNVVQDETGLDIDALREAFAVDSFGKFNAPHPLWQDSASGRRLRDWLSNERSPQPLPFVIGYEKPSGSILLVGTRRVPRPAAP